MDVLRFCVAALLGCAGLYLFATGLFGLVRAVVLRWAAGLLGQHQGGELRNHAEVYDAAAR